MEGSQLKPYVHLHNPATEVFVVAPALRIIDSIDDRFLGHYVRVDLTEYYNPATGSRLKWVTNYSGELFADWDGNGTSEAIEEFKSNWGLYVIREDTPTLKSQTIKWIMGPRTWASGQTSLYMPPEGTRARDLFEDPVIVGVTFESGAFTSNLFGDGTTNEFRGADFLRPADPRYYIEYPKFQPFVGTVNVGNDTITRTVPENISFTDFQGSTSNIISGSIATNTIRSADKGLNISWGSDVTGFLEIIFLKGHGRYKKELTQDSLTIEPSQGELLDVSNMDVSDLTVSTNTNAINLRVRAEQLQPLDVQSRMNVQVLNIADDVHTLEKSHIPDNVVLSMSHFQIVARDVILGVNYSTSAQEIRIPAGDWSFDIDKIYDISTVMSESSSQVDYQIPNLLPRAKVRWSGTGNFFTVLKMIGPITSVEPVWIMSVPYIEKDQDDTFSVFHGLIKPVGTIDKFDGGHLISHEGFIYTYGSTVPNVTSRKIRSRNPRRVAAFQAKNDDVDGYIIPKGQGMFANSDMMAGKSVTGDGTLYMIDPVVNIDMTRFDVKTIRFLRPLEESQLPRRFLPSDHTGRSVQLEPTLMEDYVQVSFDDDNDVMTIIGSLTMDPRLSRSSHSKIRIGYYDDIEHDMTWTKDGLSFRRQSGAFSDEDLKRSFYKDSNGDTTQFIWLFTESIDEVLNVDSLERLRTYQRIVGKGILRVSYNARLSDILQIVDTRTVDIEVPSGYSLNVSQNDLDTHYIFGEGTIIMTDMVTREDAEIVDANFFVPNLRITETTSTNYLPLRYVTQNEDLIQYPGEILFIEKDLRLSDPASTIVYLDDINDQNEIVVPYGSRLVLESRPHMNDPNYWVEIDSFSTDAFWTRTLGWTCTVCTTLQQTMVMDTSLG